MRILQLPDVMWDQKTRLWVLKAIEQGKVFMYPTDTVYGLGCDATSSEAVKRIRDIKKTQGPFSVIAPSKEWILKNCMVRKPKDLDRLPGPYTLILRIRDRRSISREVATKTLGVRIPSHPVTEVIQSTGMPFVTTSANMSGEIPAWTTYGIPEHIARKVDVAIHDDILNNPPSTIIDLTGPRAKKIR